MAKRVFLIVLDSVGIGEMPDAHLWGDEGSNTVGAIRNHPNFNCPNLTKLGLFNIDTVGGGAEAPEGSFARMHEASKGKDTTIGHWEIAGIYSPRPLPTYPEGFPKEVIEEFENRTGKGTLCNLPYSGTDVIRDFGEEHLKSGDLIVYTSADSVFQIAAHEDYVPLSDLYKYCEIAREMLKGEHAVGRVIARPFKGEANNFYRTSNRHDYAIEPPKNTLDYIKAAGKDVISVGKIKDIFASKGITEAYPGSTNPVAMESLSEVLKKDFNGLCFTNLVDFDSVFGHRNNIDGYAQAVSEFDAYLKNIYKTLREDDVFIITSDHGCDPATPSTDHSREYTFGLFYGKNIKPVDFGTIASFASIGKTILSMLGIENDLPGDDLCDIIYNKI